MNQDGRMASPRSYFMGRSPRPDSAPHNQFRMMQQHQQQQQFQQFQPAHQQHQHQAHPVQQQQPQQHQGQLNNHYNPAMMAGAGHHHYQSQANTMAGYGNNNNTNAAMQMPAGISPTPSVRSQMGMQASPALAATAPQHFGPSVCHLPQAQINQTQGQQQPQPMYNNCPPPVVSNPGQQGQQAYSHQANYGPQAAPANPMTNAMGYNNFHSGGNSVPMPCNNPTTMAMNNGNGYPMNQQCGHMQQQQQQQQGNSVVPTQGFNNPCSPCNGHHHHQQPVCNSNPVANNNWQCGYTGTNNMQQQQMQPFQQNGQWNNQMQAAGTTPATNQGPMNVVNNQTMMYNMAPSQPVQANGAMSYNSYNTHRPPPYSQAVSAIQCQDVSQSQDFINRARNQEQANQTPSVSIQQASNNGVPAAVPSAPNAAAAPTATPSNMRLETYQRTLEYVQQCQSWTGDNNNGRVAKENKPPQQQANSETMSKTAETAAVGRAMLSPGQDAVSSSTDRQEAAAAAALLPSSGTANQSNMIVHDMNTSLNSLMQENRFLQMIQ